MNDNLHLKLHFHSSTRLNNDLHYVHYAVQNLTNQKLIKNLFCLSFLLFIFIDKI